MQEEEGTVAGDFAENEVGRVDTGIRIALTALFLVVAKVLDAAFGVIIAFELVWTLVTKEPPSPRLREFANRIIGYYYRIGRYLTYNESRVPFPFSDFPSALEGDAWDPADRESDVLGHLRRDESDDDDR